MTEPEKKPYTRIDIFQLPSGELRIMKYCEGWTAGTPATENYMTDAMTLAQVAEWLTARGWIIRRWPGGMRAWRHKIMPIRTKAQIIRKRDELSMKRSLFPELQLHALDLAYDL